MLSLNITQCTNRYLFIHSDSSEYLLILSEVLGAFI